MRHINGYYNFKKKWIKTMPINGDSNSTDQFDNTKIVITGGDNTHIADVKESNGEKRLLVDAQIIPTSLGTREFLFAKNGGSTALNVDGDPAPVEFTVAANASKDLLVEALRFYALDSGIKVDKFLGENTALTNGILVEIKSDDEVFTFPLIKRTTDFHAYFALSRGEEFNLIFASGEDSMIATFFPEKNFFIRKQGTFGTDDYIKITIQDNIDSVNRLEFFASIIEAV